MFDLFTQSFHITRKRSSLINGDHIICFLLLCTWLFILSCKNYYNETASNNEECIMPCFKEVLIAHKVGGIGSLQIVDYNNNGSFDLLASRIEHHAITIWDLENLTSGDLSKIEVADSLGQIHSAVFEDINMDGRLDIIGGAYVGNSGLFWWRNNGGIPVTWNKYSVDSRFTNMHQVKSADVNNDGLNDIIAFSSNLNQLSLWINKGGDPPSWDQQIVSESLILAKSLDLTDVDGDGDHDIVSASLLDHTIVFWKNEGGNPIKWNPVMVDQTFEGAHYIECVDIDMDGRLDLLGAAYVGHEISWWKNNGVNFDNWTKKVISNNVSNACVARADDLDNDLDMDIIATAQGSNQIFIWENLGGTPIKWKEIILSDSIIRPWPLVIKDIDSDGDKDIFSASSHRGSGKIIAWLNQQKNN